MTKFFLAAIAAVALVGALSTAASAKSGKHHHHHRWHGGSGLYIVGNTFEPDCYMVTKYSRRTGKPFLVEVCS